MLLSEWGTRRGLWVHGWGTVSLPCAQSPYTSNVEPVQTHPNLPQALCLKTIWSSFLKLKIRFCFFVQLTVLFDLVKKMFGTNYYLYCSTSD